MLRRLLIVITAVVVIGVVFIGCCTTDLVLWSMRPSTPFDPAAVPAPTDYTQDASWIALPTTRDDADITLPTLPAATSPAVDVFFLHSTSSIAPSWNALDVGDVRAASISGGTLIQASVFNGCCAVYAPGYTQASGIAFIEPSVDGERAKDVAFRDVRAAFDEFVDRTAGRPFILAAHSQGSFLGARLLRERIVGSADQERLVAAYLIGAPLTPRELGVPACTTRAQTGCVVTYNARGPRHGVHRLESAGPPVHERLCVNPVNGSTGDVVVEAVDHGGAVFFDAASPTVLPRFARSRCHGGRLVVDALQPLPDRGVMPTLFLHVTGGENYHPIEYQLFYVDLRLDAVARAAAFVAR